MDFRKKWEIVDEIGVGGQGKVFQVYDNSIKKETDRNISEFFNNIKSNHINDIQSNLDKFFGLVYKRLSLQDSNYHKALKILHKPEDARDFGLAKERIDNELKAMHDIQHPNLLKIIEYDIEDHWFVSKLYQNGTLAKKHSQFYGKALYILKKLRPLIEGVSELHQNKIVHRDIKPENIFLNNDNELILGDFGLVFFIDNQHSRISNTFSNVGSRDWMPGWAMSKLIEEVNPSFDVFALGKIIWSLISGIPLLQLWYFKDQENDLEKLFPEKNEMRLVNKLLSKCIVERERDCIPNGSELLSEVNATIDKIESKTDVLDFGVSRSCKVCGNGTYDIESKGSINDTNNFGLSSVGSRHFLIFTCNNCGHVQLFSYELDEVPKAWNNKENV